ncbi:Fc receptor-like protein 5 isoform X1 [Xyrauchen texanus]|uniref:Fc receptor-like protein 5 isoform X1 n=1 Tax=Xyrauchen texanus TaxID=154827 RepID=UPI0022418ACD|nr:Fc receptor-like protein 5 isoform X1 [Xyrauchen texanus]
MGRSLYFLFISLAAFVICGGGSSLRPVLSGPSKAYLKSQVQFHCEVKGWSSPLTYELRKDAGILIATEENAKVTFSLKVTEESEGKYYCRVTTGGQTSNTVQLQAVIPVVGAMLRSVPDPPIIYEGEPLVLSCLARKGTHLSYTWYHKQEVAVPSVLYRLSENTLTVDAASEHHAGTYSCTAQNQVLTNPRTSSSSILNVVVKKYISTPKLSFTVFYNGSALIANISCRVARGSPPLTFRFLLNDVEMDVKRVDSLDTWFVLPVALKLGSAQCKAETQTQQLISDPLQLEVVPVGGAVNVMVTYLHNAVAEVAAARLSCVPTRGTFPAFSWSLNHSSLPAEGDSHVLTQHGQILFLTDINAASPGYYRCQVRDGFDDNSTWVESEEILIKKTDLRVTPMEVIAFVFCGFLSMVIIGGTYCILRNTNRGNHSRNQDVNQSEMTSNTQRVPVTDISYQAQAVEMKTVIKEFGV